MSVMPQLAFEAESVELIEREFTPDCTVIGLHFGEGNPEDGGQHWNFTKSIAEDDPSEGVCTVKEIQEVTVYGGITRFVVSRDQLLCEFDDDTSPETGVRRLRISYALANDEWVHVAEMAKRLFEGEGYFQITE